MYICSNGHDEICYDQRDCPLCKEKDNEIEELICNSNKSEDEVDNLRDKIYILKEIEKLLIEVG